MAKFRIPEHLLLVLFLLFLFFSRYEGLKYDEEEELRWVDDTINDDEISMLKSRHDSLISCDFSKGKWVYDQTYPLYDSTNCPYLSTAVTCQKNGRPDSDYQKLKWKPRGCSIPRFDALDFLGRMRRKRIMLVGDSIMRNQWESLVCLVQSVIPTARKTLIYNGPTMAFLALDFEMSIEFCWAPLLVELRRGPGGKRILHLDLIEDNAKYWRGVDVLVYDSAHWWTRSHKRTSWDFVMEGNNVYRNMINPTVAYEKALMTWAKWIDLNLDPRRTRVFFRSFSPTHNRESGLNKCYNQKEPHEQLQLVLQKVVRKIEFPVYIQDITTMSALRSDGHPSIYAAGEKKNYNITQQLKDSDCSHWCLPGVPDTWNEILNAML